MAEIKEQYSFQRLVMLGIFSFICLISMEQLAANTFRLSSKLNSRILLSSGLLFMSSEHIKLILSVLSLFFVIAVGSSKEMRGLLLLIYSILLFCTFVYGVAASSISFEVINYSIPTRMNLICNWKSYFPKNTNPFYSFISKIDPNYCDLVNETDWDDSEKANKLVMPCGCSESQMEMHLMSNEIVSKYCDLVNKTDWDDSEKVNRLVMPCSCCESQMLTHLMSNIVFNCTIIITHSVIALITSICIDFFVSIQKRPKSRTI